MALLVEIPKNFVSGVATGNIPYPCFVNWGTTGRWLVFLFMSVFGGCHLYVGETDKNFLKIRMETRLFPELFSR